MFNPAFTEVESVGSYSKSKRDLDLIAPEKVVPSKAESSSYQIPKLQSLVSKAHFSEDRSPDVLGFISDSKLNAGFHERVLDLNINTSMMELGNGSGEETASAVSSHSDRLNLNDEDEGLYPDGGWRAYSVITGSFLCCFTLFGLMNSIGAIESYVQENQLSHTPVATVSWIFSLFMFVSLFLGLFVGPLYDSFGSRSLLFAGSLFTFVGLFTCGACTEVYQFILSFGICTGIGTGLMMFPAVSTVSSWFGKKKRSFAIGMAQSGGSFGGMIFPIMLRFLYPKYGFNWAMRIMAFFNLGVDLIGTYLARDRLSELHEKTGEVDDRTIWKKIKGSVDLSAFKGKQFVSLSCGLFMNEFSLLITLTYLSSYAMIHGISQAESFNMLTIMNAAGVLGKFIPSYFADFYGTFNMMILMSLMLTVSMFVVWLPFGKYQGALYLFVSLFGFGCASTYALTGATVSTITRKTKDFGKRYGTAYAFVSFGNLVSLPISGSFIKEKTVSDYNNMVIFAASTCAVTTILFVIARYTIVGRDFKATI
ncbi:DEKNAAC102314 [Brettanomyces naardenensis]|uniref:DEKNAAC102314 n=1 Tax=Brettanomyces naardenensis TaxID=13370 RepID=A0A448YKS3_BRENA|nr:DEKNAAC102314 [Brettanomyces naardenensis]